jgi:hypothetical protein
MSKKPNIEKYFNNESLKRKNKSHSHFLSSEDIDSTNDINSYSELYNNNISEFYSRIDDYEGYFTTQQIESIDYSNFAEHVFFDSALEKVNFAYSNILNYFPYDKSFFEVDQYFKKLSGFERYLLNNKIECSTNYFDTEGNYYIEIKDQNGIILDDFKGLPSFKNFNPLGKEFSFDFNLYVNSVNVNNNKFVFCYNENTIANSNAENTLISLKISNINTTDKTCNLNLELRNEQTTEATVYTCTIQIETDAFVHLNFSIEKFFSGGDIKKRIVVYKNGKKINFIEDGSLDQIKFVDSGSQSGAFYIGKAGSIFSGLIDEFRYYIGKTRSQNKIAEEKNKNVYSEDSLVLYLKFNEPSGEYVNNNLIIDSSGKKLHGIINQVDTDYERSGIFNNVQTPLIYEKTSDNPVLFMNYGQNSTNKLELQAEAKFYDLENPNSFWKLLPKNIFIEGSDFDNIGEVYVSNESAESQKVLGESKSINQTLIKIFSIWARFFDELKLYIDSLSEIINLNYDSISSNKKIDGIVLPLALKSMGFDFKEIFSYPINTKLDGKNLTYEKELSSISIRQIQNILWKRFLINSQDYVTSKGTKNSLRTIFNSFGLEVDRFVKIREITGQNIFNIQNNFYESIVYKDFINFSKINENKETFVYIDNVDGEGNSLNEDNPNRYRRLPNNILNLSSYDNYFDSRLVDINENWNFECLYRFNPSIIEKLDKDQSLVRFNIAESMDDIQRYSLIKSNKTTDVSVELSEDANKFQGPYIEVYFERKKKNLTKGKIVIKIDQMLGYANPNNVSGVYIKDKATLEIEDVDLMSGQIYLLNVSKKRISAFINKYEFNISSIGNSSYSSTVRSVSVELDNKFWKRVDGNPTYNTLQNTHDKRINITIGPERYRNEIDGLLSDSDTIDTSTNYITNFQGFVSNIRLFNRSLSKEELRLKRKDIEIISNESIDNLSPSASGLDRTLLNIELKEDINAEYSDAILNSFKNLELYSLTTILDELQGKDNIACYLTCTKNEYTNQDLFFRDKISVLRQASEIDMPVSHNNVYINSFEQESYKDEFLNINKTGLSQTPPGFVYNEDLRMYIDFSMVNFINQDISKILIANDFFTKMLNNTSNFYEEEYKSLEVLRQKYFKRLSSDLNIDILYQVYKYFDNILSDLLQEAVPSKVNYLGFNFVYESHLLERNKYRHKMSNSRLPVVDVNNYSSYSVYDKKIRSDDILDFDEADKSVVRNKR